MNHIPSFKDYNTSNQLVNETYAILEGSVSHEDLEDVLSEGIFSDLKSGSDEYTAAQSKLKVADKAKAAKINALRKKEEIIIAKMDTIGGESDKLTKYVNKVKLEIRMRANDATIKLADDEMARVLQQLQKKDAKEVKNLDKELVKAA